MNEWMNVLYEWMNERIIDRFDFFINHWERIESEIKSTLLK